MEDAVEDVVEDEVEDVVEDAVEDVVEDVVEDAVEDVVEDEVEDVVEFFQFSKRISEKRTAPLNSLVKMGSKSLKLYGVPSAKP